MTAFFACLTVLSAFPALAAGGPPDEGGAAPRAVTDNANDLIVPAGDTYYLHGCNTYMRSVQINGTLIVNYQPLKGLAYAMVLFSLIHQTHPGGTVPSSTSCRYP